MEQKVIIENLAWKRGVALCWDHLFIITGCVLIMMPVILMIFRAFDFSDPLATQPDLLKIVFGFAMTIPLIFLTIAFVIFYEPFCTYKYGWTLGKKICGLRVVDDQGKQLSFMVSFLRFLMKSATMSVPYVNIVLLIVCYYYQSNGKKALWDQWIETNVVREHI